MKKVIALSVVLFTTCISGNYANAKCTSGDCVNGQGTFTLASGNKYVGQFKDNNYNGQGTFTWTNGDKYIGQWKDDKQNGKGTQTFGSDSKYAGDIYVGQYKDNQRNGQGTYIWADGDTYVGQWKDGKQNGQGNAQAQNHLKIIKEQYDKQGGTDWLSKASDWLLKSDGDWLSATSAGDKELQRMLAQ